MAKKEIITITPEGLNLLTVMNYANIAEMNGFYGKDVYFTGEFEGDTQYLFQALGNLGAYARDKNLDTDISFIIISNKIVDEGENTHFIEFRNDFANKLNQNNSPYKRVKLISEEQLIKYIENRAKITSDDLMKDLIQKYIKSKKMKVDQASDTLFLDLFQEANPLMDLEKFRKIESEIITNIIAVYDNLKNMSKEKYTLFISRADYIDALSKNPTISAYVCDYQLDIMYDTTRIKFLNQFLNTFYSFSTDNSSIKIDDVRFNLELMVYCHIWESDNFLKSLYRLAHLVNGEEYPWKVEIPSTEKSKFIKDKIRIIFDNNNNYLGSMIKKAYNSSIRNSFAHSQFGIDLENNRIDFYNYSSPTKPYELKNINFEDWCEKFVYTALFSYYMMKIHNDKRKSFVADIGTDKVCVKCPNKSGEGEHDVTITVETKKYQGKEYVEFRYLQSK